jgi:hypothetical protein
MTRASDVLACLQEIYPRDEAFRALFADKVIRTTDARNNRVVRYILCELERQHSGQDYEFDSNAFNIEHVLPQNPQEGWEKFSDEEVDAMLYRIGNMVLLAKGANKNIGNAAYAVKRPALLSSGFGLTQQLAADNEIWTPERIAARQKALAKLAAVVWRID